VRPATARSLAELLPNARPSPLSSPCLSPHLSDADSPMLRNRFALHIGGCTPDEDDDSPDLGSRKVKLQLGSLNLCGFVPFLKCKFVFRKFEEEDQDFLITLHILENLMPYDSLSLSLSLSLSPSLPKKNKKKEGCVGK